MNGGVSSIQQSIWNLSLTHQESNDDAHCVDSHTYAQVLEYEADEEGHQLYMKESIRSLQAKQQLVQGNCELTAELGRITFA